MRSCGPRHASPRARLTAQRHSCTSNKDASRRGNPIAREARLRRRRVAGDARRARCRQRRAAGGTSLTARQLRRPDRHDARPCGASSGCDRPGSSEVIARTPGSCGARRRRLRRPDRRDAVLLAWVALQPRRRDPVACPRGADRQAADDQDAPAQYALDRAQSDGRRAGKLRARRPHPRVPSAAARQPEGAGRGPAWADGRADLAAGGAGREQRACSNGLSQLLANEFANSDYEAVDADAAAVGGACQTAQDDFALFQARYGSG